MAQMSDDDLLSQLENMERQAMGYYGGEIAGEQSKAMDYYLSKPFGTEEEGRSRVVSSDVWDVVEGLTPLVAKTFFASDDLVTFNAVGPEDEEAALQETAYINHAVIQKNDSFNEIIAAIKTGLLQKVGVVKYWWEKSKRSTIERYNGLSDDEYAILIKEDDVTVVQHTETQAQGQDDQGQPAMVPSHDVVIRVSHEHGEARYCVIPPEEFRISRDAQSTNPKKARYVGHITKKTISEIREMGYDIEDDIADFNSQDPYLSEQYLARRISEEAEYSTIAPIDPSMREVTFSDAIVRIDFDGDGIAELRRVCKVGRDILLNEETEEVNYAAWTPYPQPFKFYGRCPADETVEIQLIKSTLWRQSLDNIYTINNNRVYASEGVNLDDLLDNQIAGVVRVKAGTTGVSNHIMQAEITPIGAVVQPMIEYLDSAKENRTGFSRYNQGSADLGNQKTLGEVQIVSEQSGQRVELIARSFAEQLMKPLMLGIHGLCQRNATKAETIRLRGKWVTIDPREWQTRDDMTISVGLGNADQRMKMQAAQMILGEQGKLMVVPGLVTPSNMYNAAAKLAQSVGEKSPEKYFTDPSKQPPAAPPDPMQDPHYMLEVAKHKQEDRKIELEARFKQQELDIKHRDSVINGLVAAGNMEANIAKAINEPTLMSHLERVQTQLEQLQTAAASEAGGDDSGAIDDSQSQPAQAAPRVPTENPAPPQIGMGAQPGATDGQA